MFVPFARLFFFFLLWSKEGEEEEEKTKENAAGNGSTFFPLALLTFSPARYSHFVQLWIQTNNQYRQIKQIDFEYVCYVISIAFAIFAIDTIVSFSNGSSLSLSFSLPPHSYFEHKIIY